MEKKRSHHPLPALFLGLLGLLAVSCADEPAATDDFPNSDAGAELLDLIVEQGGLNAFTLPHEQDYPRIPQDPKNPLTAHKVLLGKMLFFETGMARDAIRPEGLETYSCASCHIPGGAFLPGVRQGIGDGGIGIGLEGEGRIPNPNYEVDELDIQPIRPPTNINVAYVVNATWDGKLGATGANQGTEDRWDGDVGTETNHLGYTGIETQAIAGMTIHRMQPYESLMNDTYYGDLFDMAFPDWPAEERISKETAGLAIAAYERSMLSNQAPFQQWLRGDAQALTENQKRGAALFFGKAGCSDCHKNPALGDNSFHALGMGDLSGPGVVGNFDAETLDRTHRGRGGFTGNPEEDYAFKVPQLYNLKDARFLGHGATFNSIREVVEYKNAGIVQNPAVPPHRRSPLFRPLGLSPEEVDQLVDFLENALHDPNITRYVPDDLASGNCFPNNDPQSRQDWGCE